MRFETGRPDGPEFTWVETTTVAIEGDPLLHCTRGYPWAAPKPWLHMEMLCLIRDAGPLEGTFAPPATGVGSDVCEVCQKIRDREILPPHSCLPFGGKTTPRECFACQINQGIPEPLRMDPHMYLRVTPGCAKFEGLPPQCSCSWCMPYLH